MLKYKADYFILCFLYKEDLGIKQANKISVVYKKNKERNMQFI